jgi:hypothetical protein
MIMTTAALIAALIDNAKIIDVYKAGMGVYGPCSESLAQIGALADKNDAIVAALRVMVASARAEGRGLDAVELGEELARAEEYWPCPW